MAEGVAPILEPVTNQVPATRDQEDKPYESVYQDDNLGWDAERSEQNRQTAQRLEKKVAGGEDRQARAPVLKALLPTLNAAAIAIL